MHPPTLTSCANLLRQGYEGQERLRRAVNLIWYRAGRQGIRHFPVLRFSLPNEPAPEVLPRGASSAKVCGQAILVEKPSCYGVV